MSGGSLNYLYRRLLYDADFACDTPERKAFAAHLKLVARALHDIEWVDSGDYGPGDENEAIRACLAGPLREAARNALSLIEQGEKEARWTEYAGKVDAARDALRKALGGE